MSDKKPDKTEKGVAATLAACGSKADQISMGISAGIIASNLADGAKGSAAITSGARIPASVGQCVADQYEGTKPSTGERVGSYLGRLSNAFTDVATNIATIKDDAKLVAGQALMSGVSAITNGTPEKLQARPAQINNAAAGGPGS